MKFKSEDAQFFSILPEHFSHIYPNVEFVSGESWQAPFDSYKVLVEQNLEPSGVVARLLQSRTRHLLQKNNAYFADNIESLALIVEKPGTYFEAQAHALIKNPIRTCEIEFSSPDDKVRLKKTCEDFVAPLKTQNVSESVEILIEELYMNAVLDAPREAQQKGRDEHPYLVGQKAKISLVMNDQQLAISCFDPYGSLKISKFILRMQEVYAKGAGEAIRMHRTGGAGLGCIIMFEQCSSLYLGVIPDRVTVVGCVIPLGLSYRQRAGVKKSLHLIEI